MYDNADLNNHYMTLIVIRGHSIIVLCGNMFVFDEYANVLILLRR